MEIGVQWMKMNSSLLGNVKEIFLKGETVDEV